MTVSASDIRFEPAAPRDTELLIDLARAFHREDGHPLGAQGEAALRQIAAGEPLAACWLIRRADEVIGYVVLTLGYSIEHGGRDGFIDDLYLIPSARGSGVGSAALDFALQEARRLGIQTLHLEVDTANDRANALYRSRGFRERPPLDESQIAHARLSGRVLHNHTACFETRSRGDRSSA